MKNVLIVDDEKPFLLSLTDGLSAYAGDFNVLTVENGEKALDVLKSIKVDLVVTDLKMPVMDGFDLLSYMSRNHADIPVIVMTAISTPKGIVVMRCSGTDAKSHFHLIGIMVADGNQALMKMQIEKMVPAVMAEIA